MCNICSIQGFCAGWFFNVIIVLPSPQTKVFVASVRFVKWLDALVVPLGWGWYLIPWGGAGT